MKKALVTGAGGFIGFHMVKYLQKKGYYVRGVDIKKPQYEKTTADEFLLLDLRKWENANKAVKGMTEVYNFAANMGGIGFIETVHAEVLHDNVLINAHILEASRMHKVKKFFFSSSACIYPRYLQNKTKHAGLKESQAYPADPDNEYGWEKLYAERLCRSYLMDYGLEVRIARFHNVYGPLGTWRGGREKSPAAVCRKVALAKQKDTIEVWGDGKQGRSYCYIDDCLAGIYALMQSDIHEPVNIGSNRLVTINELIGIVAAIAGKTILKKYDRTKPQGVRGRNANIMMAKKLLGWVPKTNLEEGLAKTYSWILSQI